MPDDTVPAAVAPVAARTPEDDVYERALHAKDIPWDQRGMFYIPEAPSNVARMRTHGAVRGCWLRWVNTTDKDNLPRKRMPRGMGRPGYEYVAGKTVEETKAIVKSLGYSAELVDTAINRVAHGGHALMYLPATEFKARLRDSRLMWLAQRTGLNEAFLAKFENVDPRVAKPFAAPLGEIAEMRQFVSRTDRPFVSMAGTDPRMRMLASLRAQQAGETRAATEAGIAVDDGGGV